jgi:hypothetical protein
MLACCTDAQRSLERRIRHGGVTRPCVNELLDRRWQQPARDRLSTTVGSHRCGCGIANATGGTLGVVTRGKALRGASDVPAIWATAIQRQSVGESETHRTPNAEAVTRCRAPHRWRPCGLRTSRSTSRRLARLPREVARGSCRPSRDRSAWERGRSWSTLWIPTRSPRRWRLPSPR